MHIIKKLCTGLLWLFLLNSVCYGQETSSGPRIDIKEFRLDNGMMFLIVERHVTPQIACRLAIRAGSALEDAGKTGIVHLLEHMMFKGTKNFGTTDLKKDEALQNKIESAYQAVLAEEQKRNPDQNIIKTRREEMDRLRLEVKKIYVPQALSSQLEKNGAVGVNAFTTKDETQFTVSVPSDMAEQWFSIASEQIFEPSWREFYVEKEVVQREWAYRYTNSPEGAAWLDLDATAYSAHPYRNPTIGWKADMEHYNTKDAISFHKKYYTPENAVCVLVGDITVEKARKLAETYFSRYPGGNGAPETVTREPLQQGPKKTVHFMKGIRTPIVRIGFHSAPMATDDFYALDALTMILSSGHSAVFTQNLINKGTAIDAWAANPDNRYGGMFILGGSPAEPDGLDNPEVPEEQKQRAYLTACENLENLLLAEIEKVKSASIDSELKRIRKLNQRNFLDRLRSNEALAGMIATLEVETGWRYLTTYLDKISRIEPEDIRRVIVKYIEPYNKTSVYVIPGGEQNVTQEQYEETRGGIPPALYENVKAHDITINNSIYKTPNGWKHPLSFERKPEKIKYPDAQMTDINNARIFYLPDNELPLVDLTCFVKAGRIDLDESLTGLDDILGGSLIRGGTKNYPPSKLAMFLDENAIRLSVSVGEEESAISLSVMKGDWEKGLGLLEEILTQPSFNQDILDVVKQQAILKLKRQGEDAQSVAYREGTIWHFKGHPYGHDPLTGINTIPKISADNLMAFIRTYFVPSNMAVAVSGDIDENTVNKSLTRLFSGLPTSGLHERKTPIPPETPPVLAFINKPGQVQSQIMMFLTGLIRSDPDFWKMRLLMDIFGGSDSIMYTRLRDDLGLVYSAGFYQTYKWMAGTLNGYIGAKGDKTVQAIAETIKTMDSLKLGISDTQFNRKRMDALNSFVFNVDTPADLCETYSHYYLRGEPLDTLERIQDTYLNSDKHELLALAKKFLDSRKLQIFIVGDKLTKVKDAEGGTSYLGEDLKAFAKSSGFPYEEIGLK